MNSDFHCVLNYIVTFNVRQLSVCLQNCRICNPVRPFFYCPDPNYLLKCKICLTFSGLLLPVILSIRLSTKVLPTIFWFLTIRFLLQIHIDLSITSLTIKSVVIFRIPVLQSLPPFNQLFVGVSIDTPVTQPARALELEGDAQGVVIHLKSWRHPELPLPA